MNITRFDTERDVERLSDYLRERYAENRSTLSWLPERLHDIIYRMGPVEGDGSRSADFIFLFEEEGEIKGCILPDGENIYFSVKKEYSCLFGEMLAFAEQNCLPLFHRAEDGSVKFWVAVKNGEENFEAQMLSAGYEKSAYREYINLMLPENADSEVALPAGFALKYGSEYADEVKKWTALGLGFHPERENTGFIADMSPYEGRKSSSLYPESFECIVTEENSLDENNVCAYCFVYTDRKSGTAVAEPVATREKYRHKGFGTALMHAAAACCRETGIERLYVNCFGDRKDFYCAAGFEVESEVCYWYKKIDID